jgi:small-conductance mechanosensitive channel
MRLRWVVLRGAVALLAIASLGARVARTQTTAARPPGGPAATARAQVVPDTAPLIIQNRPIVVFRAPLGARTAPERAAAAAARIRRAAELNAAGELSLQRVPEGVVVSLGPTGLFAITPADLDPSAAETLDEVAARAVRQLQIALQGEREQRSLAHLLRAIALAVIATLLFALFLRLLVLARRFAHRRMPLVAKARVADVSVGGFTLFSAAQLLSFLRRLLDIAWWVAGLFAAYLWLTFVLTRFPYTAPWGEALGAYLVATVRGLALGALRGIPGLFTVVLIFVGTRFLTRLVDALFRGVEAGEVTLPWVHADTAQPTRRLVTVLLWLFAIVVAYPYLPGSDSNAFKGVSVFVGLVLSLGSSGLVNQAMSGLVIMYARAFRPGDYVRIGDTEGVVSELGMLSTKVRTNKREEVTIPNAVLVGTTAKNYTRLSGDEGVLLHTTVTIGYDTPWRQVQALLILAADRTPGLRRDPRPFVRQSELSDFYVAYEVNAALDRPEIRIQVLSDLHANILDCFNEYGVQIMSPHYEGDPSHPKVVGPSAWSLPPADGTRGAHAIGEAGHIREASAGGPPGDDLTTPRSGGA